MLTDKTFATTVREAWLRRKLTIQRFARRPGVSRTYAGQMLAGRVRAPLPKVIRRVARVLGLDYEELLAIAWVEKRPRELKLLTLRDCADRMLDEETRERILGAS